MKRNRSQIQSRQSHQKSVAVSAATAAAENMEGQGFAQTIV